MKAIQVPHEYEELSDTVNKYKDSLVDKFKSREHNLISELENRAIFLKQQIVFYSRETSKQNIDCLIAKKRAEKEIQRLALEVQWRQLTEKLRKFEEQYTKLIDMNKEAEFDLNCLKEKIDQLRVSNLSIENRITDLKNIENNMPFITETKMQYTSPYKFKNLVQSKLQQTKTKENPRKVKKILSTRLVNREKILDEIENSPIQPITIDSKNSHQQLMKYLSKPEVRDKIIKILLQ